ncbi:MAG: fibrobacter succinogenes major paralogous domain-containing protein [Flavobacteriaceae bacterium]|nr:fibrobacter succinogenes major paralogous domain-containing protein [Flavobacteriaceae bacterium]
MNTKGLLLMIALVLIITNAFAQVGIGTETPDPSAKLDVTSTTQGFLPPRMTFMHRDLIPTPAEGLIIYNTNTKCLETYNGTNWINICDNNVSLDLVTSGACTGEPTQFTFNGLTYKPVESNNKCWLDRNLGATQVATSSTDAASYGDLYQWGRLTDGHEIRTSANITTQSVTDVPGNANFITTFTDWRSPKNDDLWQDINGINNPCPSGYRLPTETELDAERLSWGSNNAAGAFASPLKFPRAGRRVTSSGSINGVSSDGRYWSSTVLDSRARDLFLNNSNAGMGSDNRAFGFSVRCLKD